MVEVDGDGVTIGGGQRIQAATVVWAGGVDAPPWVKTMGLPLSHGRVITGADLRVPGHPSTFAAGDLAAVSVPGPGGLCPQLAQVAIQTGRHAGRQIRRLTAGLFDAAYGVAMLRAIAKRADSPGPAGT